MVPQSLEARLEFVVESQVKHCRARQGLLSPIAVPEGVQPIGRFLFGAGIQQPIKRGDDFGVELANLGDGLGGWCGQGCGPTAAETDVDGDRLALGQRHIFDEQRQHAFAVPGVGMRIMPHAREIAGEGQDTRAGLLVEQTLIGLVLALVLLL